MYRLSAFATLEYCVMGIWISRDIADELLYLSWGIWIAQMEQSASQWPTPKLHIYCCFLAKRNTFLYDFWVGWLMADIEVCQNILLILMF